MQAVATSNAAAASRAPRDSQAMRRRSQLNQSMAVRRLPALVALLFALTMLRLGWQLGAVHSLVNDPPSSLVEAASTCIPSNSPTRSSLKPRHLVVGVFIDSSNSKFCDEIKAWSKETHLYFFSIAGSNVSCHGFRSISVPTQAPITKVAISELQVRHSRARWVLILWQLAWVHIPRLKKALSLYDFNALLLLGLPKRQGPVSYCSGRSGIVLSQELAKTLHFFWSSHLSNINMKLEQDVELGQVVNSLGIGCSYLPGFFEENIADLLAKNRIFEQEAVNDELFASLKSPIVIPTRDVSRSNFRMDTWTLDFLYENH